GELVALFGSLRVDALGVVLVGLAQLAFLPTMLAWTVAWIAGPGFAIGLGTAVSPGGTQLGVLPGIPVFGLIPEGASIWMLVITLVPVGAGAVAGWVVRSRAVSSGGDPGFAERAVTALG